MENKLKSTRLVVERDGAAALSVVLQDGSSHVAMMHYSYDDDLAAFYFSTDKGSIKFSAIRENGASAALAIGTGDNDMQFLQLWGTCTALAEASFEIVERHIGRNPSAAEFKDDPETVYLKFVPSTGRLTDYELEDFQIPLEF